MSATTNEHRSREFGKEVPKTKQQGRNSTTEHTEKKEERALPREEIETHVPEEGVYVRHTGRGGRGRGG